MAAMGPDAFCLVAVVVVDMARIDAHKESNDDKRNEGPRILLYDCET